MPVTSFRSSFQQKGSLIVASAQWGEILAIRRGFLAKRWFVIAVKAEAGFPPPRSQRTGQAALLDSPVLQGLCAAPLDPTLRLARIGAVISMFSASRARPNWGHAVAAGRALMIDDERHVLVTYKAHWLSPGLQ